MCASKVLHVKVLNLACIEQGRRHLLEDLRLRRVQACRGTHRHIKQIRGLGHYAFLIYSRAKNHEGARAEVHPFATRPRLFWSLHYVDNCSASTLRMVSYGEEYVF